MPSPTGSDSQDHGFMELMSRCTVIKQQISSYETPRGRVLGFLLRVRVPFYGYKKTLKLRPTNTEPRVFTITEIWLPTNTLIVVGNDFYQSGKLRADRAKVLNITSISKKTAHMLACSDYDPTYTYKPRTMIRPKLKFDLRFKTCASGIHFFMKRTTAVNYS